MTPETMRCPTATRRHPRRARGAAWLLAATLAVLAGCGGSGTPSEAGPAAVAAPAPSPAPPAAPPVTVDPLAPRLPDAPSAALTLPGWPKALPAGFPAPAVPADNPMSLDKVALGRHLFFDERLSGNQLQSCGTCHQPTLGFGQARRTPFGSTGQTLPRNSPPLANVAWFATLTWGDDTQLTLEQQMHGPLFSTAPVEMGVNDANRATVLARIAGAPIYAPMFAAAFPGQPDPVTWDNVIRAIASFQRTIVSGDSRWDRAWRGEQPLDAAQARGRDLFFSDRTGCAACHGGPTFAEPTVFDGAPVSGRFHNIGLYNLGGTGAYPAPNRGRFERTGVAADMGAFRTPSLRNVEVTAPYMHDGSVATLAEVIELYAAGGRDVAFGPDAGDGRENPFKSPIVRRLDLSEQDKADLLAFLKSLTDTGFLNDPQFANPFATP